MAWYRSTTNTTGITTFDTPANALSVLNTFFTACAAEGASFLWEVASYQSTSPRYLVLKRKSGANGRLMFFGGDSPNAAQLGPSVTANTTSLYVGYDRTASTDTPTNAYTGATLVWGGSVANWHYGRQFGALDASASQLRAYCNSTNDSLAVFWTDHVSNVVRGHAIVGLWLRDESGTAAEGLTSAGSTTYGNGIIIQPVTVSITATSTAQSVAYCTVYNSASNEAVRIGCHQTAAIMYADTQASHNERMQSPAGFAKFLPFTCVVLPGGTVTENRLYSTRNVAWGPMKTLNFQWTDNAAAPKGYYIGFINTTADLSGLSLIDDSF